MPADPHLHEFTMLQRAIRATAGKGMFDEAHYEIAEETLSRGDTLLVYTDGVTEAANMAGEMFGRKRLKKSLDGFHTSTAAGAIERVITDVGFFTGEAPRADDVTLLAVRYA